MDAWKWLVTRLYGTTNNEIATPSTSETSIEVDSKKVRTTFDCPSAYKFAKIFQQQDKKNWCEWHYNTEGNENAVQIAKNFRRKFEETNASSSIADNIAILDEVIHEIKPSIKKWDEIRKNFKVASDEEILLLIIKAYTYSQELTGFINKDFAANTYHALELYCTLLNCPILARTEEYTEAFTSILFHPLLKKYLLIGEITVYRGSRIDDDKLVDNYKEGNTIITTTFLSTTTDPLVVEGFSGNPSSDYISMLCEYKINNKHGCTALDLRKFSPYDDEQEILILRYTPFRITDVIPVNSNGCMKVYFEECE